MTNPEHDDLVPPDYDSFAADTQDAMRARCPDLIKQRLASLDLQAVFEADGRPYAVLGEDGSVSVRGAEGLHHRD